MSRLLESSYFIPFFFPVVSTIIAFHILFRLIPIRIEYSLAAVLIAHVFYNTPIFIKYISEAWRRIDNSLIDHTVLETRSSTAIFIYTILPHIAKSAARAFFLVFTFCFTSFGIILSLGNLSLTNFEIAIYSRLHTSIDITGALSLALVQFLILIALNVIITRTEPYELAESGTVRLPKRPFGARALSILFLLFEGGVLLTSLGASVCFSVKKGINFFSRIFTPEFNLTFPVIIAFSNSFMLAVFSAFIVTVVTYLLLKLNRKTTEFLITSLFSISTAMLSIALVISSIRFAVAPFLLLSAGFLMITLPVSFSFMQQHVQGFDSSILEQGKIDGASWRELFTHIEFPILLPVFVSNFLQIAAIVFGEFTLSYMFQAGNRFPLISVVTYSVHARRLLGEGYAINTVSALIVGCLFAVSVFVLRRFSKQ